MQAHEGTTRNLSTDQDLHVDENDVDEDERIFQQLISDRGEPVEEMLTAIKKFSAETENHNLFVSILGRTAISGLQTKADRVSLASSEVHDLFEELSKRISNFSHGVWDFMSGVAAHAGPRWYRNVDDLTDWEPELLGLALRANMRPNEGSGAHKESLSETHGFVDYARYLQEMFPRVARRRDARIKGNDYLRNVRQLLQFMDKDGSPELDAERLRLELINKAHIACWDSPRVLVVSDNHMERLHIQSNHNIGCLLNISDSKYNQINYWNFVEGFHILYDVWYDPMPSDIRAFEWRQDWRNLSFEVLSSMHRKASDEIRASVALVVNSVRAEIPAELEVMIYEATMEAENIPLVLPESARGREEVNDSA